jgi:flagellar motor protein MotB
MSRKKKPPASKPSKAYLVSFGDTMTALLAFFIVLNSFAKDQTGANMHSGTGSFVNAISSIGLPGTKPGKRTHLMTQKKAPAPLYAVHSSDENTNAPGRLGPDSEPDQMRIIDRQTEEFKRFLTEISRQHDVEEQLPTRGQIVLDSFEKFQRQDTPSVLKREEIWRPLQENAVEVASEAISQLTRPEFELEIVVWAPIPSSTSIKRTLETAAAIESQIENSFTLDRLQQSRISYSVKPWLFVDAKRPKVSFILSRLDLSGADTN